MKNYWIAYIIALFAYILFNVWYINFKDTMGKKVKLPITLSVMAILAAIGFIKVGWLFLWAVPFSIFFWAFLVNTFLGLALHNEVTYKSDNWPDNLIKMHQNPYWFGLFICMFVSSGLLYYIYK